MRINCCGRSVLLALEICKAMVKGDRQHKHGAAEELKGLLLILM